MTEKVIQFVREAAKIIKDRNINIEQKGNVSNYVTSADIAVQEFLTARLTELLPDSQVLGEEGEQSETDSEYIWVIDPIDGTSNFIRDLGLSVISVALLKNKEPYLGVVYHPERDEMFYAEKGKGTYKNGEKITVSNNDFAHSHLCSAMSLYDKRWAKPCFNIIERVYAECDDMRRLGSAALEMAQLAAGRVELYFEIRLFPWDVAAAALIIKEAGGYVEFMFYTSLPLSHPFGVIAANTKENFEKLKEIVYKEIPEKLY